MFSHKIFNNTQLQTSNLLPQSQFTEYKKNKDIYYEENILDAERWTQLFLVVIQNQHYLIFKDDFNFENLVNQDLEKFKSFAHNWLVESIIFFNNVQDVDYYAQDYKIAKKLQLTGFRKKTNFTFELFFNFKSKNQNQNLKKIITITFDLLSDSRNNFVNFVNKELQSKIIKYREINFQNETYNISAWKMTRSDFFWKIDFWIKSFKEVLEKLMDKINQKFSMSIKMSNNINFVAWKVLNDNKSVQLKFYYQRFDVELIIDVRFSNYNNNYFNHKFYLQLEKSFIETSLNVAKVTSPTFDYILKIEEQEFFNLKLFDKFFYIYRFLINLTQKIVNVWDFSFTALSFNARIRFYNNNFHFNKISALDFSKSGAFNIELNFSTVQKNHFTRILKIEW